MQLRDPGLLSWQQGTVAEQKDCPGATVNSQQAPPSHPGFVAPALRQQLTVCPHLLIWLSQLVGWQMFSGSQRPVVGLQI
jgi:hypothetical protein